MTGTTDRYRDRHGDAAYARLAARAAMAGLESLAADLLLPVAGTPAAPTPAAPTRRVGTTPGRIAGRDTAGRALPLRDVSHAPVVPPTR